MIRRALALALASCIACGSPGRDASSPRETGSGETPGAEEAASGPASPPAAGGSPAADREDYRSKRLEMVDKQIAGRGVNDPAVLEAMRRVPRHRLVPENVVGRSYEDRPLPIGLGQTISQPYIVALMTELLAVKRGDKVLEIGTGSGYQAAILAELTDSVHTIEIIPELADRARNSLRTLGYSQVHTRNADGYFGWGDAGPFDAIIVTAAPDHIPPPLVAQLKDGGRLVIPVGPPGSYQTLWRITKRGERVESENITDVLFVPLVRKVD
ncbi:MAG: protein-L-isoaspartate(D-aspartate) O-methyltransferase [Actinomycetota bacterium]|nr:protein-L-isoaspartate(D-aspartate) O-methyltransferase [Actinomycetota bacterium]